MTPTTPTAIAAYLKSQRFTVADLARRMGVGRQTCSNWIHAQERCPRARQAQIAVHTGVRASVFFDDETGLALQKDP